MMIPEPFVEKSMAEDAPMETDGDNITREQVNPKYGEDIIPIVRASSSSRFWI